MQLIRRLISASPKIKELNIQTRAEILSSLLIFRAFAILSLILLISLASPVKDLWVLIGAFGLNLIAYFISRTQKFTIAAIVIIVEPLLAVPASVMAMHSIDASALSGPIWLGLGPIISSLVLPTRYTIATIAGTLISFTYILLSLPPQISMVIVAQMLFVLSLSGLALIGSYIRDKNDSIIQEERSKVQQVTKLSALGEMAGGIAHELNTPLAAIMLNMEIMEESLQEKLGVDSELEKRTQNVMNIVNRMSKVISGLKTFSRDARNDGLEKVSLKNVIDETVNLCGQRFKDHGVELRVVENGLDIIVEVQPVQLSQVLLNLLNNSFDAIQSLPEKWIQIERKINTSGRVELYVSDCGNGISKDNINKLFQPFFTTKAIGKGTGLGLSISKGIVNSFGGDLIYEPAHPNTCFIVQLPELNNEVKKVS
jgi:signal transduction histidine kinase